MERKKVITFAPAIETLAGNNSLHSQRRDGRVVDYNGLENRRAERHRGFESLSLRSIVLLILKSWVTKRCGQLFFLCVDNKVVILLFVFIFLFNSVFFYY